MVDLDRTIFDCPSLVYFWGNMSLGESNLDRKLEYVVVNNEESKSYANLLFFLKMSHSENFTPLDGVVDILNKWYDAGIEVVFVSSRVSLKPFHRATVEWLENNGVKYKQIILDCNNKAEYGKQNSFDMIIDDTLKNCTDCMKMGITPIWIRNKYNKNVKKYPEEIMQVHNWQQIDEIVTTRLKESQSIQKSHYEIHNVIFLLILFIF